MISVIVVMSNSMFIESLDDKVNIDFEVTLGNSLSETVKVVVVLHQEPTEDQINLLKTVHNMSISRLYSIIPAIAGKLPIDEVFEIIKYEWVKEVWLDEKLYVMKS